MNGLLSIQPWPGPSIDLVRSKFTGSLDCTIGYSIHFGTRSHSEQALAHNVADE